MRIAIVGAGVVGHATGMGLSTQGHEVLYCDTSASRRTELAASGYPVVASVADTDDCGTYMICVPTRANAEGFDLSHVIAAIAEIANTVRRVRRTTVVVRSTLLPGTMRSMVLPALEAHSGLRLGEEFGLCYNPEFLRAATALDDLMHPPITVVGEFDAASADLVAELHRPFGAPVMRTSPENAEAIKCFSNVYNASKVSFFNLLYLAGQQAGFDPVVVARGMQTASLGLRVPSYYTEGGYPYGGECLPKDLSASLGFLRRLEVPDELLQAVKSINEEMARQVGLVASEGALHEAAEPFTDYHNPKTF